MNINSLVDISVLMNGLIVVVIIYGVRALYLKYAAKTELIPELYISPRGLISILLYFSIPSEMRLNDTSDSLLLFCNFGYKSDYDDWTSQNQKRRSN